jgi:hypothetical protein
MAIDWSSLNAAIGADGVDIINVVLPFIPALARSGEEVYAGFLEHLGNADWDGITELMYQHMTVPEREALEEVTYQAAFEATQAKYDNTELMKTIAIKIVIGLLLRLATGGIV